MAIRDANVHGVRRPDIVAADSCGQPLYLGVRTARQPRTGSGPGRVRAHVEQLVGNAWAGGLQHLVAAMAGVVAHGAALLQPVRRRRDSAPAPGHASVSCCDDGIGLANEPGLAGLCWPSAPVSSQSVSLPGSDRASAEPSGSLSRTAAQRLRLPRWRQLALAGPSNAAQWYGGASLRVLGQG